jgi:hypothetical protein
MNRRSSMSASTLLAVTFIRRISLSPRLGEEPPRMGLLVLPLLPSQLCRNPHGTVRGRSSPSLGLRRAQLWRQPLNNTETAETSGHAFLQAKIPRDRFLRHRDGKEALTRSLHDKQAKYRRTEIWGQRRLSNASASYRHASGNVCASRGDPSYPRQRASWPRCKRWPGSMGVYSG